MHTNGQIETSLAVSHATVAKRLLKDNNFDALRLFLAFLVMYSHCFALTGFGGDEPLVLFSKGQWTFGGFAVGCFFILSGYLITASRVNSQSVSNYMVKRLARIYPGFLVTCVFCYWVLAPAVEPQIRAGWTIRSLLGQVRDFLLLRITFRTPAFADNPESGAINGSLWTIPIEFMFYVVIAICGLTMMLRSKIVCAVVWVAALAANGALHLGLIAPQSLPHGNAVHLVTLAPYFFGGMLAWVINDQVRYRGAGAIVCTVIFCTACLWGNTLLLVAPPLLTYLLLYLGQARWLPMREAGRWGDFSYGVYLYAFPLQQLIVWLHENQLSPHALFALAFLPTLLAGVLSWHLVEKHFLNRRRLARIGHDVLPNAEFDPSAAKTTLGK